MFSTGLTHGLVTAYPFVMSEKPVDSLRYLMKTTSCKFMILDSGIFTLFRDAAQGHRKHDAAFFHKYADRYIAMVKAIKWKWPLMEVDCQNFGDDCLKELPAIRKKFYDAGLGDQTIFVWHHPDGPKAFRGMLEQHKRVALPGRALSANSKEQALFKWLVRSNRDLTPGRHIHLLGAVNNFTATLPDNYTGDSSNWAAIGIHGHTDAGPHTITYRRGKLTCPAHLLEQVRANMDRMVEVYKGHPEHVRGKLVRRNYLTYMACGLHLNVNYFQSVRKRNPGSDLSVIDPIDYRRKP